MTSRDFCYWLQGYFEIHRASPEHALAADQVATIRNHLAMVFMHEIDQSFPKEQQADLNKAHAPKIGGVGPNGELYRC